MSSIDERIVQMRFDNKQFEEGISQTTKSLAALENSLALKGIASNLDTIASRFSTFGAIAFTAIQNLTNAAIGFGQKIAGSILDPLVEGGKKRALNIEQAKFQFEGLGMDVEATMASALAAVRGTAFGLDEAAVVAANFGATGMRAGEQMTNALRGISGVAAMAGASYSDIGNIFQKVAGQGRLMGDDLNRLAARGINAAATMSQALGITESEFRDLVSQGKVSFQEFADAMNNAFGEHATKANETYTGSLSNMRAALARIGAKPATQYFENQRHIFNALTPVIDKVAEALDPVLDAWNALSKISTAGLVQFINGIDLGPFRLLMTYVGKALPNFFKTFEQILKAVSEAFSNIFPGSALRTMGIIGRAILGISEGLKMGMQDAANLRRTFEGVFALFDIGWMIIKEVVKVIASLFGGFSDGRKTILGFTGDIGEMIVSFRDALRDGEALSKIFTVIGNVIRWPIEMLQKLGSYVKEVGLVRVFASAWEAVGEAIRRVGEFLAPVWQWFGEVFTNIGSIVTGVFQGMDFNVLVGLLNVGALTGVGLVIQNAFKFLKGKGIMGLIFGDRESGDGLVDQIKGIFGAITDTFGEMQKTLKAATLMGIAVAIGLLTAAVIALSFVDTGKLFIALGGITVMITQLVTAMLVMDKLMKNLGVLKITAITLMMINLATALLILSTAVKILSTMSWDELLRGLTALGVGLGILVGAALLLKTASAKLIFAAPALFIMASAMLVLSAALKIMGSMSWDDIFRSMATLAGTLAILVTAMEFMHSKVFAAASILIISAAMVVLASALKIMASMSWDEVAKSLVVLAGSMAILVTAMEFMHSKVFAAASLFIIASALTVLSGALIVMASMSWEEIAKSLVVLAGSLAILAGAMYLMGNPMVLIGAIGITAASAALMMLAPALKILGSMSWDDIGRGLAMLGASLAILAVGGVLIIPAAVGFLMLGTAMLAFGTGAALASVGLFGIASALTAIGIAISVGAPALRSALLMIISLIPELMTAFAKGIIDFALVLVNGRTELTAAMTSLILGLLEAINNIMPEAAETIKNFIRTLLETIVELTPDFVETAIVFFEGLLTAIETIVPRAIETTKILIVAIVDAIVEMVPYLVEKGMELIAGLLSGIAAKIDDVITSATDVIIAFVTSLGDNGWRIVDAGVDTLIKFIDSLSNSISDNKDRFLRAGSKLFRAVVDGVASAIENGGRDLRWAGERIGQGIINGALAALGINSPSKVFRDEIMGSVFEGIDDGTGKKLKNAYRAGQAIGDKVFEGTAKSISKIANAVASDINADPVVRPVLDLTSWKKDVRSMTGMIQPPKIKLDASYARAEVVDTEFRSSQELRDQAALTQVEAGDVYTYNQTITSPKPVSAAETYRQTKNLISTKKGELPK